MNIITFDVHLITNDDLISVREHILEHQPCLAFYKITYPPGNTGHFMCPAEAGIATSVSIGKEAYEAVLRINA